MKTLVKIICIWALILPFAACSNMDEYKDIYTDGKEIRYAGKANDAIVLPGHDRMEMVFVLGPDPNIAKAVIYWAGKNDSIVVPIDRSTMTSDTVRYLFDSMPEGSYGFMIFCYDKVGNVSVPTNVIGRSYGIRYINSLSNRTLLDAEAIPDESKVVLIWGEPMMNSLGVNIKYVNTSNEEVYRSISNEEDTVALENYKTGSLFEYKTQYKPDTLAIDTFYAVTEIGNPVKAVILMLNKSLFSAYPLNNDSPKENAWNISISNLWDGLMCTNPNPDQFYNDVNFMCYQTNASNGQPTSFTVNLGKRVKLQRFRCSLYWPYMSVCPKRYELWGYPETGAPPIDGDWSKWTKLASLQNTGNTALYAEGDNATFSRNDPEMPLVQYVRIRCLENWRNDPTPNISISEVTFWEYSEE